MSAILELIAAHRAAWDAFQVAPDPSAEDAEDAMQEAMFVLCTTPVASEGDALALLAHLDWYVSPAGEGEHAEELPIAIRAALHWGQQRGMLLALAAHPQLAEANQ